MKIWLRPLWRSLVLCCLLLALPMQSMAVASMRVCCPSATWVIAAASVQNQHSLQEDIHAKHHPSAHQGQADAMQAAPSQHSVHLDSTVLTDCASCPACHAVAATIPPAVFTHVPALVLTLVDTSPSPYRSHIPEGLQRPPALRFS